MHILDWLVYPMLLSALSPVFQEDRPGEFTMSIHQVTTSYRTKAGKPLFYLIWIPLFILFVVISSQGEGGWFGWIILQLVAFFTAFIGSHLIDRLISFVKSRYDVETTAARQLRKAIKDSPKFNWQVQETDNEPANRKMVATEIGKQQLQEIADAERETGLPYSEILSRMKPDESLKEFVEFVKKMKGKMT
jgi:hypothetical protein